MFPVTFAVSGNSSVDMLKRTSDATRVAINSNVSRVLDNIATLGTWRMFGAHSGVPTLKFHDQYLDENYTS
jgi:hypothetical protein